MKKTYPKLRLAKLSENLKFAILLRAFVLLATALPFKLFAQAPSISYGSPQVYAVGSAIPSLSPASSNVASPAYGSPVNLGSGFSSPAGMVVDNSGNIYVADEGSTTLIKIQAGTLTQVNYGSGFSDPGGLAIDASGDVYVADAGNNKVKEIPAAGGIPLVLGSGFNAPAAVAVDAAGNVYVADYGNSQVKKIPFGGGATTVLGSGFSHPTGVAVDAYGNVYVCDYGNQEVKEIPAGSNSPMILATATTGGYAYAVCIDASGNLFLTQNNYHDVYEVPAGSSFSNSIDLGTFTDPVGITADVHGNVYIGSLGSSTIQEVKPAGGYFILPALPAGLSFNATTGVITGTPANLSPAANYTVTAYNTSGSGSATVNITIAPVSISYSSPQTYTAGTAITPLTPISSGVAAAGYSATPVVLSSGFSFPDEVAVDGSGNVYVADLGNSAVKEIPAGSSVAGTVVSGFLPAGVAVDAAGNVYVTDYSNLEVKKIPAGNLAPVVIGSGYSKPKGIAVDAAGNVYVSDAGTNTVYKIVPGGSGTGLPLITTGLAFPYGLAVDALGDIFIADQSHNAVKELPVTGGPLITLGSGFSNPQGVAVDPSGNVFVGDFSNGEVKEIPAGNGTPVILGSGFSGPSGVTVDASGNLYVADYANHKVKIVSPVGGFYLGSTLPAGLSFSNATGAISGTPTKASAAANYKVTAYTGTGSSSATINITVNAPSAPYLSYASPQTYTEGIAIAPLSPASTGVGAQGYSGSAATIASGFSSPYGVAADAAGNVYVGDSGNNVVKEIPAVGGNPVPVATGFNHPAGVTVDSFGNVYVVDQGNNEVKEILKVGGSVMTIASGFNQPTGIAIDAAGNIYVSDSGNNAVKEIPAAGGSLEVLGTGFSAPAGVAVDAVGNVYVADNGHNAVKEILANGGATVPLGSGFSNPQGVSVDAAGNVFVGDNNNNAVKEIPAGNGTPVLIGSGFYHPAGVFTGANGIEYVADENNNVVKEIKPVGGYYLNAALPAGLIFNYATGSISGTPTVQSLAANYTITAYNDGGSNSALLNITVIGNNPGLSALTISKGTLTPAFSSATTSYAATVANGVTSVTETATTIEFSAPILIDGTSQPSGTPTLSIPLSVGPNVINTFVTAQDGVHTQDYTITVTRAASSVAYLSSLKISNGALTPAFSATTNSYTATVAYGVSSITVTPTTPGSTGTITVNNVAVASGSASQNLPLAVGPNIITTVVTAADGVTTNTYTLVVTETASPNATLASLVPGAGSLSPAFSPGTISYTESVANSVAAISITPTATAAGATITVNTVPVPSGTTSNSQILYPGPNTISIMVTAPDGVTTKTYTVIVTRAPSSNANLSTFKISNGTLTPAFSSPTTSYAASVANGVASITVTPTSTDPTATITVNNVAVPSGSASQTLPLVVGPNTITTKVTAGDGVTTKTYTLVVTEAGSSNANLSALKPGAGTLSPAFTAATTSYTDNVVNGVTSISFTPTTALVGETVTINGIAVASGTASSPVALNVGANVFSVMVTAQDGVTTKTYTVVVTRASSGADSYVPGISVITPTETPAIADDGIVVHQAVSPNGDGINDILQIDNIGQYPDNRLMIMNRNGQLIYQATGYDNSSKVFDGHSSKNGQMQLPGTYFYQLDYIVSGVTRHKTGFIVLKY